MAKGRGNSSTTTSGPMAAPTWKPLQVQTTWNYLTYLQYQGNLAISKLLAWKNCTFFAIYILLDELLCIFGRWWWWGRGGGCMYFCLGRAPCSTHTTTNTSSTSKNTNSTIPPGRQLPAASILMASAITLHLHNMAMLLFLWNQFIFYFICIYSVCHDWRAYGQKVCFLQWINMRFYCLLHESTHINPSCPPISFSPMLPKSSLCFGMILDKGGGHHGHHDVCVRSVVIGSLSLANFVK